MGQQLLSSITRIGNRDFRWRRVRQAVLLLALSYLWSVGLVTVVQAESPRFETFATLPNSDYASAVVLGDFNGDGLLDVVVGAQQNHLYLNQGAGLFTADLPFGTGEATTGMATGDFNNDGALDLVVTTTGADAIYLNQGNPNGTTGIFAAAILLDQPAANAADQEVLVGDFNGDGALDLVISSRNAPTHLYLNRNDGTGALNAGLPLDGSGSLPVSSMAAGDLNGDGALDLVLGLLGGNNRIYFNQNNGSGAFASAFVFGDVSQTMAIVLADLNSDDHLDLVVGNNNQNMIYLNDGLGQFPAEPINCAAPPPTTRCFSTLATESLVAGDLNGDGALDLLLGGDRHPGGIQRSDIQLYLNDGSGRVITDTVLTSSPFLTDLALGDLNADGLLDLVVGNYASLSQRYLNTASVAFAAGYALKDSEFIHNMAVGDLNGDSALDLIISPDFGFGQGQIYRGDGKGGFPAAITPFGAPSATTVVAVADMNGDGTLDLVTSGGQAGLLYLNDGAGNFSTSAVDCLAPPNLVRCYSNVATNQIAVGDLDGNGALDLIVATAIPDNRYQPYRYLNQGDGTFAPGEALGTPDDTLDLGLGDLDNDGDLDLVVAYRGQSPALYRNNGLGGFTERTSFNNIDGVSNLALGDLNGDGALDLVVGIGNSQIKLYLNDGTGNFATDVAFGNIENAFSMVLGDLNGDGALDLVVGNGSAEGQMPMTFYLNDGTGRFVHGVSFGNRTGAISLTLGDFNGDGALDLVKSNFGVGSELYLNHTHLLRGQPANPTAITVQRPLVTDEANFYSASEILSTRVISIPYTLTNNPGEPVGQLHAFYSLNGGGQWRPAIAASGTQTTNLRADGTTYIFYWDTFVSGFFGQSDNVVVRLEARTAVEQKGVAGTFRYPSLTLYPRLYPYASATTFPFRVRGTQVRVVDRTGQLVPGALVYRLATGQTSGAAPFTANVGGAPYRTNAQGYLQGKGALTIGDQLVALQPISATHAFSLYYTSAAPTATGLALQPVTQAGVQTLTVSAANPLVLFDLDLTLEWDARNDDLFLEQLDSALARTSSVLFDVSNGQMALGNVRIHQNGANAVAADIVLHASNSIHPRASMGGVVITPTADIGVRGIISNAYLPGQIHIGVNWDPFGQNQAELTEDWSRALAHELAHYLLFLPDNYLGIEANLLRTIDCRGSFMTNAHDAEAYSEFLTRQDWQGDCRQTVAERLTGRTDWETILRFFPWLHAPNAAADAPGPSVLPLDVLRVSRIPPSQPSTTLPALNYDLRDTNGQLLTVRQAQVYLLQSQGTPNLTDDRVLPLGSTGNGSDHIKVRGATPGDRLCVFAANQAPAYLGCRPVTPVSREIQLAPVPDWQPVINVTPLTSRTLAISVTQITPPGQLNVQVLPAYGSPTATTVITAPWVAMQVVDPANPVTFTQVITLAHPAFDGFVRVWRAEGRPENGTEREALTQFFLSAAWGPQQSGFGGTDTRIWGPQQSGFGGADKRAWGANHRALEAPMASGDGKVTIFNLNELLGETGVTALQTLANLPQVPLWLTPVGQGYRLTINEEQALTIAFHYLQREAPAGYEYTLHLYYSPDNGATWQRLPTLLNIDENLAAAQIPVNAQKGAGIYALMATLTMPALTPGWNQFAYPLPQARPVPVALASLGDAYTVLYHFDPTAQPIRQAHDKPRWRVYAPAVAIDHPALTEFVNDLTTLTFGQSYWLHATAAITPYLGVGGDPSVFVASHATGLELPPAIIYGVITVPESTPLAVGAVMTALVDGNLCGQTTVESWQGRWAYKVQVAADTGNGCGAVGRTVTLTLQGTTVATAIAWDNRQPSAQMLVLGDAGERIFLPLVQR